MRDICMLKCKKYCLCKTKDTQDVKLIEHLFRRGDKASKIKVSKEVWKRSWVCIKGKDL